MESTGRPFGTERSPIFSLRRHVEGQTQTKGPVDRLDREVGAGGRRRSRRKDQDAGQRAQRGKRPEESRGERKADAEPSRRSTEAKGRDGRPNSKKLSGESLRGSSSGYEKVASEAGAVSFKSHLSSQAPVEEVASGSTTAAELEPADLEGAALISALQTPQSQKPLAAMLGANRGQAVPVAAASAAGRTSAVLPQAALTSGNTSSSLTAAVKKPTPTTHSPAMEEQFQAAEAQRSAQILRQVRMQLHPGMRSATIQLAPAELGRLSIRLRVENGEVHAVMRAETGEALSVLQNHLPELEASFADLGFEEMTFEFVLDQENSGEASSWLAGQDVSAELEKLIENEINPALRRTQKLSDIEVDTYA